MKNKIYHFFSRARFAVLLGGLVVAGAGAAINDEKSSSPSPKFQPIKLETSSETVSRQGPNPRSFSPIVKKVAPSVVTVSTVSKGSRQPNRQRGLDDGEFFNPFDFPRRRGQPSPQMPHQGLGSGVIVTKDGYILTNNHVVDASDEIKVLTQDGSEYKAKLVGKDPKTDIAVLKIEADNLPYLTVGDSDQIEVGDLVLAVGNPFGVGQTVTMGMVSAMGRGNMGMEYEDFIQTDAAINPGNSGGALVDADGRLIGINTAIISRSGGNQGIGFAVPSNLAKGVFESLINNGRVIRGYLGIHIQDVTPALAKEFELKQQEGALVAEVQPNSPAEKAGFALGDIVLEFQNKPVRSSRQLKLMVSQAAPGSNGSFKVLRDGKQKKLTTVIKELKDSRELSSSSSGQKSNEDPLDGLAVTDLSPQAKKENGLPSSVKGVMVTEVHEDSAAFQAGLRPGDIIQEVNRQKIGSSEDLENLQASIRGKALLRVWSKGGSRYVVVQPEDLG